MAWSFTDLKYGWRYVVGISLAATTIYVANNTRWRINQADEIELDLAVAERCLATQYGTNAAGEPLYRVDPPEYVRSWYSNSYVTTNVPGDAVTNWTAQLHTNIYTNTVGFRTDHAKAVARDATIKALIPYYVDPDSVYDGTTNIVMLTVTGLWASLSIGDGTNQFTQTPAIGTNAATYGPWAWRNYVVAWQERYKVLEAMKMVKLPAAFNVSSSNRSAIMYGGYYGPLPWGECQTWLISLLTSGVFVQYANHTNGSSQAYGDGLGRAGSGRGISTGGVTGYWAFAYSQRLQVTGPMMFNTNLTVIDSYCQQYILESVAISPGNWPWTEYEHNTNVFKAYAAGDEIYTNVNNRTVVRWDGTHEFLIDYPTPEWLAAPLYNKIDTYGSKYDFIGAESYIRPQFLYCINAFWE